MTPACSILGCPLQCLVGTGHEDGGHRPPLQVGLGRGSQALQTMSSWARASLRSPSSTFRPQRGLSQESDRRARVQRKEKLEGLQEEEGKGI